MRSEQIPRSFSQLQILRGQEAADPPPLTLACTTDSPTDLQLIPYRLPGIFSRSAAFKPIVSRRCTSGSFTIPAPSFPFKYGLFFFEKGIYRVPMVLGLYALCLEEGFLLQQLIQSHCV